VKSASISTLNTGFDAESSDPWFVTRQGVDIRAVIAEADGFWALWLRLRYAAIIIPIAGATLAVTVVLIGGNLIPDFPKALAANGLP